MNIFKNSYHIFEQYKESMEKISSALFNVVKQFEELPKEIITMQDKLLDRGWYVFGQLDIRDIRQIINMNNKELDEVMSSYGRKLIVDIPSRIFKYFPYRTKIINEALKAHELKLYYVSIPTLLSQSDGISYDLLEKHLFSKKNNIPKTKIAIEQKVDRYKMERDGIESDEIESDMKNRVSDSYFLRPLCKVTSISMNTDMKEEKIQNDISLQQILNRHEVLHGLDTNYGNEYNSLRCIVLLSYLLDLKEHYFLKR